MNLLDKMSATRCWGLLAFLLIAGWLPAQNVTVSGRIMTVDGSDMEEVELDLESNGPGVPPATSILLSPLGYYSLSVPIGSSFTIRPSKDNNPLNGVTTYDMVLISRHALGLDTLTNPYAIIAADVNNSGAIEASDTTDLRQLIIGTITEFPNNTSWRFVRADYVFPDPLNPFAPPFPEEATFTNITANVTNVDFIAVKIGDVNFNAIPNGGGGLFNQFLGMTGTVHYDENKNCSTDPGEPGLSGWIVTAQGPNGLYYASTTYTGTYYLNLPSNTNGNFKVFLTPPNALWDVCTDTVFNVPVVNGTPATVNFDVQATAECPVLEVDLSAARLRRCFNNNYSVVYRNNGTVAAENAQVEVAFDPFLEVQSSSIPWSTVTDNVYTFPVGDVAAGSTGHFDVMFKVSCDASQGQTHCSTAHIFPDSSCVPPDSLWNGANLLLSGECQGNEIVFTITNTGADMTEPVGYVVIEDIMIQMTGGTIQLDHDESETITLPANGSTWRLEVDQSAYHPGSLLVSESIEGCGANGQGSASLGIIPLFPTNDAGLFENEDCQQNIGSFDPNDKQGFPLGIGAQHFIPQGQEIEYMIRFQNTGTDTAFNIIVLDTISNNLDLSTLRLGGSSHAYDYHILGKGVIQFVFPNILLPDSTTNEVGSHGYVKYTISPKVDRPDGTVINNRAAIFFDFNLPVLTNKTRHTLGSQFLDVSNVIFQPGLSLEVFPNPSSTTTTFSLKTIQPTAGRLRLYDVRGRLLYSQDFDHNVFDLDMQVLPPGLYFFRLNGKNGAPLAAGKIVRAY